MSTWQLGARGQKGASRGREDTSSGTLRCARGQGPKRGRVRAREGRRAWEGAHNSRLPRGRSRRAWGSTARPGRRARRTTSGTEKHTAMEERHVGREGPEAPKQPRVRLGAPLGRVEVAHRKALVARAHALGKRASSPQAVALQGLQRARPGELVRRRRPRQGVGASPFAVLKVRAFLAIFMSSGRCSTKARAMRSCPHPESIIHFLTRDSNC